MPTTRPDAPTQTSTGGPGRTTARSPGPPGPVGYSTDPSDPFQTRPFLKIRRGYTDILAASRRKDIIHGMFEIDVTESRRMLNERAVAGEDLSFTAFLISAVARAVDDDKIMHGYRRRRRLILFDDVDVNTQIEAEAEGQLIVQSLVIRAANRKTVTELTHEIRAAQRSTPESDRRYRKSLSFLSLPRPVRALAWRVVLAEPALFKRLGGTVAISSVGMFGPAGGWAVPVGPATLMVTIGGIALKPRYVGGRLEPRELVAVTASIDHAIVDGATAARFARRLTELVESASGL